MMYSVAALSFTGAAAFNAPAPISTAARSSSVSMMDKEGLKAMAKELNPVVGYFDPLNLAEGEFWGDSNAATIGFLRQAEVKHGRIAMFGFVGYIVHANHIVFPWALTGGPAGTGPTTMFSDISAAGSPIDQWAAVPTSGKLQILGTIALLEYVAEAGKSHYMNGGKIGYIPPLKEYD